MIDHEFTGSLSNCLICFKTREQHSFTALYSPQATPIPPTCPGHQCPSCKKEWSHQYFCGENSIHGYCTDCAQQTAAQINRPMNIEELKAKDTEIIDARRQKELQLEHEDFIVLNIVHLPDGSDNPDWPAKMQEHIKNMKEMQLKYKVYESAAHQVRARQEVQDLNKLTEEQKEQYLRDAKRGKTEHKEPKVVKKVDRNAEILKSAMLLMKMNPKLTLERASELAREAGEE